MRRGAASGGRPDSPAVQGEIRKDRGPSRLLWVAIHLIVWLIASLPLLLVRVAPYGDLPSHLARYEILTHIGSDPHYAAYWRAAWAPLPNLGVDFLVLGLAKFFSVFLAAKIVMVFIVGLVGFGFARLYEAWGGERSAYSLLGYGLAYGFPLTMGFLNYVMGTGLLLVTVALHLRLRTATIGAYLARMVPMSFALGLTHMVSFAQAMLVIGVLEIIGMRTGEPVGSAGVTVNEGGARMHWRTLASRLLPLFVLPVLLVLLGPKGELDNAFYFMRTFGAEIGQKWIWINSALRTGSLATDRLYAIGLLAGVALLVFWGHRWNRPARWTMLALFAVYLVSPYSFRTLHLDSRQPWVVLLVGLALLSPKAFRPTYNRHRTLLFGVLGAFFLMRVGILTKSHIRRSQKIDQVMSTFAQLPPDSLVLTSYGEYSSNWDMNTWEPPLMHLGSLALFAARAYPNTVFTYKGQQPLETRSEVAALQKLQVHAEPRFPAEGIREFQRIRAGLPSDWRARPAFVFFVAGADGAIPGRGATLLAHEGRWGLYRLPSVEPGTMVAP